LAAIRGPQFLETVLQVIFDGLLTEPQPASDFFVLEVFGHEIQDLNFTPA
jgi:hypothetical protein